MASRRGRRHGHQQPQREQEGQHGQGDRKYDVKGKPKGQGQDNDVLKNRKWKEKHKSSAGNHNRRYMADKKRMAFPPR